ncbi:MAG: hypothetical protein HDR88_15815 [Bacteroides sp.]|nr:hypothetical protein [Bacteroides sp.]
MKKFILVAIMMLTGVLSSYAIFDKYTINREELPEAAQEMLSTYFPKAKIGMIKVDKHLLKKTDYDVKLVNGTRIEFSNSGKWTLVDCGNRALPDNLVPKTVAKYISKNFEDVKTVSIKKTSTHYEVGLSDGVILKFNLLGQYKGVISIDE